MNDFTIHSIEINKHSGSVYSLQYQKGKNGHFQRLLSKTGMINIGRGKSNEPGEIRKAVFDFVVNDNL